MAVAEPDPYFGVAALGGWSAVCLAVLARSPAQRRRWPRPRRTPSDRLARRRGDVPSARARRAAAVGEQGDPVHGPCDRERQGGRSTDRDADGAGRSRGLRAGRGPGPKHQHEGSRPRRGHLGHAGPRRPAHGPTATGGGHVRQAGERCWRRSAPTAPRSTPLCRSTPTTGSGANAPAGISWRCPRSPRLGWLWARSSSSPMASERSRPGSPTAAAVQSAGRIRLGADLHRRSPGQGGHGEFTRRAGQGRTGPVHPDAASPPFRCP